MKKIISVLSLVIIGFAVYFINVEVQSYYGQQAMEKTGLQRHSLDEALTIAKSENKQVLVDVSAIWCPNCRRLDNQIFANENVKKVINGNFIFARLEYESDEGTDFLKKHNASGFPTVWMLDNNGQTIKQLSITFEPNEFIKQLQ